MNPLNPGAPAPDAMSAAGYDTPADARRMQELVQSLVRDRRHIVLTSDDAELLEHYSRLLVRDLRRQPEVKVVGYQASGTEDLLRQINEMLAHKPLDEVLDRNQAAESTVRVFLVHDTAELTSAELNLMVRLVKDLPGANLRIAFIGQQDTAARNHAQALGTQALRWHIKPSASVAAPSTGAPAPAASPDDEAAALRARREFDEQLRAALNEAPEPAPRRSPGSEGRASPAHARRPAPAQRTTPLQPLLAPWRALAALRHHLTGATALRRLWSDWPAPRRNRVILAAGLATSAALAIGMGVWLSAHTPAKPPAASAPSASVPK